MILPQEIVIKETVENRGGENEEIIVDYSGKSPKVLGKSKAKNEFKIASKYYFVALMWPSYFLLTIFSTNS